MISHYKAYLLNDMIFMCAANAILMRKNHEFGRFDF